MEECQFDLVVVGGGPAGYNATGVYAQNILGSIYEDLLELSYEKLEYTPLLAKRFEVSKDKLTYTFYLNPEAKWADGKPLTAEDVKFSMDLLLNKKLKTFAKWQSYLCQS